MPSIFECPNELIEEFLTHLPGPPSLQDFRLALTCKRLYEAILPALLKFQIARLREAKISGGLIFPELEAHIQDNTPLFGTSLDRIWLTRHIGLLTEAQIWSLHGLVARAKGLRHIALNFRYPGGEETYRGFLRLLEAAAEHEGIIIDLIWGEGNLISWADSPFVHRVINPVSKPFDSSKAKPSPPPTILSKPAPSNYPLFPGAFEKSRLARINLKGHGPLSREWYHHTQSLLTHSSSTLTRISMSSIGLRHYDWALIIPQWNFPRLSHFDVGNSQIPAPNLISFLHRHPSLICVDISLHTAVGMVQMPAADNLHKTFLPNLEELRATSEYLIPFFAGKSSALMFPKLRLLSIARAAEIRVTTPLDDFTTILSRIAARGTAAPVPELSLLIDRNGSSFGQWLEGLASKEGQLVKTLSALHGTKTLEISAEVPPPISNVPRVDLPIESLVDLVAAFPALEEVTVHYMSIFAHPLSQLEVAITLLWNRCTRLKSVHMIGFAEEEENIKTWERPLETSPKSD